MSYQDQLATLQRKASSPAFQNAFFSRIDFMCDMAVFTGDGDRELRASNCDKFINDEHLTLWADFVNEIRIQKVMAVKSGITQLKALIDVEKALEVV